MKSRHAVAGIGVWALALAAAFGQASPTAGTLLPDHFGAWTSSPSAQVAASEPAFSLVNANKAALEEDGPQRSATATYTSGGHTLRVEAAEFADYSGAWSAYTMLRPLGTPDRKDLGSNDAVADDAVLFVSGATVVVAYPVTLADVKGLQALVGALPKVHGSRAVGPVLPFLLPMKDLVPGTMRYALGGATYAAQGGVLPAGSVGWDKSAEVLTAEYKNTAGDETLTLLIYPTPQIATAHLKSAHAMLAGLGPKFANAKIKRDSELVVLADGSWPAAQAQALLNRVQFKQIAAVDRAMAPADVQLHMNVVQTFTLLENIAVLVGVLAAAAVLLALFLGGGRALIRVMRGKPAAVEPEFLSLHLEPQSAKIRLESPPNQSR